MMYCVVIAIFQELIPLAAAVFYWLIEIINFCQML
nr:unnamed protein product [Callosobruchus analis]